MQIEELIRDASAELRSATENRPLPAPRFAASTVREKRRRWQMALAAVLSLSVAALVVRALDRDRDPSQIDTVVPPSTSTPATTPSTTTDNEPPPIFSPPPANLPNYVGNPLASLPTVLERWGVVTELVVEPGVQDTSRGRIIDQQPGGGTPLTPGMRVTFRVGRPTAPIAGELEVGLASSGPRGAWRVAASAKADPTDGTLVYSMSFLTDDTTYMHHGNTLAANAAINYANQLGLVAGTAPASAVAVLLLDSGGNTVGSVGTTRSDDPRLASVSYWVIEVAKYPAFSSLRAVDRGGSVLADFPAR